MKTKKGISVLYGTILMLSVFLIQCKKNNNLSDTGQRASAPVSTTAASVVPCGQTTSQALIAGQNINSGTVTVSNDATNLYVTYQTIGGWQIQKTHLYVGDCLLIPTNRSGNPQVGLFPYQTTYNPRVTACTYTIPLSSITGSCYCVAAHAEVVLVDGNGNIIQTETGWGQGSPIGGNSWAMKFTYCTQSCTVTPTPTCVINPGDYRTQTQGGWGATPSGNNPGAYLQANFAIAFPSGLTVGYSSGYTLYLSSASAVTNFLPEGGSPSALTQNYIDPLSINNVLAGQVVSLGITLGLDAAIPGFCASSTPLSSLVVTSGTFAGWTVAQVYAEANKILGGSSSPYTASQINAAVDTINNNFDNGTVVGSYLTCS